MDCSGVANKAQLKPLVVHIMWVLGIWVGEDDPERDALVVTGR